MPRIVSMKSTVSSLHALMALVPSTALDHTDPPIRREIEEVGKRLFVQ